MIKNNTTRKRKNTFRLYQLNKDERIQYVSDLLKFIVNDTQRLEKEKIIEPEEKCQSSFDTYYNLDDAEKIIDVVSNYTENPRKLRTVAKNDIQRVKQKNPANKISLKSIILFLLASWAVTADAKWHELSAPPNELSAYDTAAAVLITGGLQVTSDLPALEVFTSPIVGCGLITKKIGSYHRLMNHYTGKYPLSRSNLLTESLNARLPGAGTLVRKYGKLPNSTKKRGFGESLLREETEKQFKNIGEKFGELTEKEIQSKYNTLSNNDKQYLNTTTPVATFFFGENISNPKEITKKIINIPSKQKYLEETVNFAPSKPITQLIPVPSWLSYFLPLIPNK